jgi:catechol 2,3-dioxygenase-like lactoylglutathione lyase family enzyme
MNFIQKNLMPLLTVCMATVLFSCNNGEKKEEPAKPAETTVTATVPAVAAPKLTAPFDVMEINHTVKDYAAWKKAFDTDSTARNASGLGFIAIGKSVDNPNDLSVTLMVSDVQKAKAFAADPRLKDVMEKNGVISKPDIRYWHVVRVNPDSKEKNWVLVTHKVKDFTAWLKGYDAEGTATRASFGLIDVALARGVEDSNLVHIVFDINDMAKAKARLSDPALKKIMMDAGVMGAPKLEFYSNAE